MSDKDPSSDKKDAVADLSAMLNMGGIFEGVSSLLTKFGELAERGESLQKSMGQTDSGKAYQTSGGFTVRFGSGGTDRESAGVPNVSPLNKGRQTGKPETKSSSSSEPTIARREPNIDIFEEDDHTLLVAEMPGVPTDAVALEFDDKRLLIKGTSKTASFEKSLELPRAYSKDQVAITANNGIIEIRLNHD